MHVLQKKPAVELIAELTAARFAAAMPSPSNIINMSKPLVNYAHSQRPFVLTNVLTNASLLSLHVYVATQLIFQRVSPPELFAYALEN